MQYSRRGAGVLGAGLVAACATTGSTPGSGVGDSYPDRPPFYAGEAPASTATRHVGYLPVVYQRGASQPEIFDPELSPSLRQLLDEMSAYLGESGMALRSLEPAVSDLSPRLIPPDVHFGCPTETGMPQDDCNEREAEALGRGRQPMYLAVGRPSTEWATWVQGVMADAGVDRTLVVTLEVGQYWIRQRGLRGTKEVELGTRHTVRFPWLASLEGPVSVLQLTGVVIGLDGKASRIGAEGLLARRTPFKVSTLGAVALVTDEEIAQLRHARRDDLVGAPLVWQEGLRVLVMQLTGQEDR